MSVSSVIAKMQLNAVVNFGSGSLSKLSCVCENDLMAAYAKSDEDRVFTKYSPWGEMKVGHNFGQYQDGQPFTPRKFYVVVLRSKERPKCEGAAHVHPARCHVVHDFGSSKQIEVSYDAWPATSTNPAPEKHPGELHWRMSIDNPPAVEFFVPGQHDYWIAFYDADKFSIQTALADAHE